MLEVKHLEKKYDAGGREIAAVRNVNFTVASGEWVGLVGESGSGKSTVAGLIAGTVKADVGEVFFDGVNYAGAKGRSQKEWYRRMQMIFQSPYDSFDPRRTLGFSLTEGLRNRKMPKNEAEDQVRRMMEICGLSRDFADRLPHQVSGGECQRAAIARALLLEPELLICDEITSALDVTIQAQILELLQNLKKDRQLSCLFISHDLALVQQICSRILVMYQGEIIEEGTAEEVIRNPKEAYTRRLVESVTELF